MTEKEEPLSDYWALDRLIESLQERAKELNCLYQIEEILREPDEPIESICQRVINAIPPGWQYPDICQAKMILEDMTYQPEGFTETPWHQSADILVQDKAIGTITVYYTREMPTADDGPFLKEETKLIKTIADRLGHRFMHRKMRQIVQELKTSKERSGGEWQVVLDLLKQTDNNLYLSIARKMLNYLCWSGVAEAEKLLKSFGSGPNAILEESTDDWNRPHQRRALVIPAAFSFSVFKLASDNLSDEKILGLIQKWIQEDKLGFLVQVVNRNLPLGEVTDAIRRYHYQAPHASMGISPSMRGIQVSLIRRLFSDQLQYINVAKNYMDFQDFYYLLDKIIFTAESHGRLGGKSAGMYLATHILKKRGDEIELSEEVKMPKTWHITSDVLLHFMNYNNLDEVVEQKYKDINQIRLEYPHIVQTFKSARFPADVIKGLSVALDDFGECPLIVRSTSLLEDRFGASFSGKYKSLFLANQGDKQQRLDALMDAIAEVYASTFSPDPIEYRAERGLLDFGEEMGIMIQEVVGIRSGHYFFPAFAGVVFSNNEFRWSPRIRREDGLVRIVPGLGTRAVDRLSDDYPVLIAPGQPGLRVNITPDEIARYSPKQIDVINLQTNSFETIPINNFMKEIGTQFPAIKEVFSILEEGHIRRMTSMDIGSENTELVANFEGLISKTPFMKQVQIILKTLEETLGFPVDIEFASDGHDFYLLQCRPQSYSDNDKPTPIPKDISKDKIIFSANRYISNGRVPDITHIVYVDPKKYGELTERSAMIDIGHAVGKLNKLLPKRQFILMGPGRWGSRGDIKLGINVGYSEINNTAVLIEIARQTGSYVPDLSFGTHFFQDLVEANIRYLPLYPDDEGIAFNENFLLRSRNILSDLLPEYAYLADTIRLIDVPQNTDGKKLRILMNADLNEAIGFLAEDDVTGEPIGLVPEISKQQLENYWHWRMLMAEHIASQLDPKRFGVVGFYVFGSTKNATAGPASDIDILIHFRGKATQLEQLRHWLEGWSLCLAQVNYLRTGYRSNGILDVHIITDEDIASKNSYAIKIGAVTDPARPLAVGTGLKQSD